MKLYKIWQKVNIGWDTYRGAIVAAESADEAVEIHPDGKGGSYVKSVMTPADAYDDYKDWARWNESWVPPCKVFVQYIGEADESVPKGVVLADYRAG